MYRVSLVDDEEWSLIGLQKSFNWEKFGFEIVSSDMDPEEALQRIVEICPDVVFTDIRMPQLSGLDLISAIKATGLDSIFVIISGFAEFNYAQEALKLGTFEYCLKPIDIKETDYLLKRLAEQLDKKSKLRNENVFKKIKEGNESVTKPICEGCSKSKTKEYFQVMVVNRKKSVHLDNFFLSCPAEIVYSTSDQERDIYILNTDKDIMDYVESYYGNNRFEGIDIGLSTIFFCDTDLPRKIVEGDIAAKSSFIFQRHGVFQYRDNKSDYNLTKNLERLVYKSDSHAYMSKDAVLESLDELKMKEGTDLSLEDIVLYWNHVISFLKLNYDSHQKDFKSLFFDFDELVARFGTINEMADYLKRLVSELTPGTKFPNPVNGINRNFKKLLAYVDEHYTENLNLQELAGKFYMNTTYCCQLFKRATNTNFSDYTTTLRMKKARVLLDSTDMSIDEICTESGYNDYYYFNKVFKKYYGITPSRFRKDKAI